MGRGVSRVIGQYRMVFVFISSVSLEMQEEDVTRLSRKKWDFARVVGQCRMALSNVRELTLIFQHVRAQVSEPHDSSTHTSRVLM